MDSSTWTRENLAWAAGFIDGEGSIGLDSPSKRNKNPSAYIVCYQKDPELLYRLVMLFGGKVLGPNSSNVHYWRLRKKNEVYAVCVALYTWLSSKRRNSVEITIENFKIRNG